MTATIVDDSNSGSSSSEDEANTNVYAPNGNAAVGTTIGCDTMRLSSTTAPTSSSSSPIYYFGYGPIVNPIVRKRRGVKTTQEKAALLPEYRLTFAHGGVVNAIRQRGYEVHGVLMAFETQEDWAKFQEFDAGYNLDQVQVYPLNNPDQPVLAHAFLMDRDFEDRGKKDGSCLEKLPQERYLKLIAAGMRAYHIDEEYIEDHIMTIPYIPRTKPEDYEQFPKYRTVLPRISMHRYQQTFCRTAGPADIYFVIGNRVIRADPHDPQNPCAMWLKERAHGKPDVTWTLHQTVIDPDLTMVDDPKDITPEHIAWAENHFVEYLEQGGMSATAIFELVPSENEGRRRRLGSKTQPFSVLASLLNCASCRGADAVINGEPSPGGVSATNQSSSESGDSIQSRSSISGSSTTRRGLRRGGGGGARGSSRRMFKPSGLSSTNISRGALLDDHDDDALLELSVDGTPLNSVTLSMELMRQVMPSDAGDTTDEEDDHDDSCAAD